MINHIGVLDIKLLLMQVSVAWTFLSQKSAFTLRVPNYISEASCKKVGPLLRDQTLPGNHLIRWEETVLSYLRVGHTSLTHSHQKNGENVPDVWLLIMILLRNMFSSSVESLPKLGKENGMLSA